MASFFNRNQDRQLSNRMEILIRKLARNELNTSETTELRNSLSQFGKQQLFPEYFTQLKLDTEAIEISRMIQAFQKYGYQEGTEAINPEFENVLSKKLYYADSAPKSLSESFGEFLPEYSNSDFVTMKKGTEKARVFMRGSRVNFNDPNMRSDWLHNIATIPVENTPGRNNFGDIIFNDIETKFNRVQNDLGVKDVNGYSRGGSLSMRLAQKNNLVANVFNPHINNLVDFKSRSGQINIHRIINDPATAAGVLQGGDISNFNVKTYPPVTGWTGLIQEHELLHFTDDVTPRELSNRFNMLSESSNRLRTIEANSRTRSRAARADINKRISTIDDKIYKSYIAPRTRSLGANIFSHVQNKVNVRTGANLVTSLGVGSALSGIASALDIDEKLNPELYALLLGSLSGGLSEAALIRLSQGSLLGKGLISKIANLSRVGSSVLSGGVGLLISEVATKGIFNAFSPDANPYLKHIFSNVIGGEIGTLAGIGIVAGIGATASALGVVSATNWWNPVGWASALALAITGVVGTAVGVQGANAEIRNNELVDYSGQSVLLRNQVSYMRDVLQEMGMPPQIITDLNSRMLTELGTEDARAMTPDEFNDLFSSYMETYSTSFDVNGRPPISRILRNQYNKYNNSLVGLADKLNNSNITKNGILLENMGLSAGNPYLMTEAQYVKAYNSLLDQSHQEINNLFGIKRLIDPNATPEIPNALPDTFSADEAADVLNFEIVLSDQINEEDDAILEDEEDDV